MCSTVMTVTKYNQRHRGRGCSRLASSCGCPRVARAPSRRSWAAVDLAIRYFGGDDPALEASLLHQDEARVYCSPGYAARHRLRKPDDVARATLLVTTMHPHWPAWFRARSRLPETKIAALSRLQFDQALIAIEAANRGQGVVLTSPLLVEEDVAGGALVEPFPSQLPLTSGYYVVHPRRWPLRPAAATVRAWLVEEARAPGGRPPPSAQ